MVTLRQQQVSRLHNNWHVTKLPLAVVSGFNIYIFKSSKNENFCSDF